MPSRFPITRKRLLVGLLAALALAVALAAAMFAAPDAGIDEADLLPVDEAFVLSAEALSPDRLAIRWKIADGYYLYRHRISVQADDGFAARPLQLPKGKAYTDEFFGEVETYRDTLVATLPGRATADRTTLKIKYQGCADAGICYPPQTRTIQVALAAPAPAAAAGSSNDTAPATFGSSARAPLIDTLSSDRLLPAALGDGVDALPLPPEQAFGFEAIAGDGNTLLLRMTPARGYYLYRDKTTLGLDAHAAAAGIALGQPQWPRGTAHRDEYFGNVHVYFDQIDVPLPLLRSRTDAAHCTKVQVRDMTITPSVPLSGSMPTATVHTHKPTLTSTGKQHETQASQSGDRGSFESFDGRSRE